MRGKRVCICVNFIFSMNGGGGWRGQQISTHQHKFPMDNYNNKNKTGNQRVTGIHTNIPTHTQTYTISHTQHTHTHTHTHIYRRRSHEPTNRSLLRALCIWTILTDSSVRVTPDDIYTQYADTHNKVLHKIFINTNIHINNSSRQTLMTFQQIQLHSYPL